MEPWIYYSILALVLTTTTILGLNYLGRILNGPHEMLFFMYCAFIVAGLIAFMLMIFDKKRAITNANNIAHNKTSNYLILAILIGMGALILFSLRSQFLAHANSSKVGFPLIIINMNVVLVLLLSLLIYRQTINWKAGLGVVLSIIGLSLVVYFK